MIIKKTLNIIQYEYLEKIYQGASEQWLVVNNIRVIFLKYLGQ